MAVGDALELVGTLNGTGSASTLTFDNIDADSSMSWIIRGMCSSSTTGSTLLQLRMNNDSNSRYYGTRIQTYEGSSLAAYSQGASANPYVAYIPGSNYNVGYARTAVNIEFYNLSDSSTSPGSPSFLSRFGGMGNGATETVTGYYSGSYSYNLGAPTGTDVTEINLMTNDGSAFPSTTVFSLYKRPTS